MICVVDDDASVLRSVRELLDSDGLEAQTFDNGEDFLAYAQGQAVKLAILDVWMPAQTGIELQERLHHLCPQTRVIIITARQEPAIRRLALDGGAYAFFPKPFDDEEFLASVRDALGEKM
jgi:FixJ family two-component response regulator